jgi:Flp pilus assembly protein TadD
VPHDDHSADAFPDEAPEARAALEALQQAAAGGDSVAVLDLTQRLLGLPLQRCADVVHLLRGDALFDQHDYANAVEEYRQAIAHGADDASIVWFQLGNALAAAGRHEEAALALVRAAQLEPEHPAVWLQLGYALLENRSYAQAELAFGNALTLTGGAKGHYGLAWLYYGRARSSACTEDALKDTALGLTELRAAVRSGELGPELEQLGAVQAMLTEAGEPDFPLWHCWINPAFELGRGTDLLEPPANAVWAETVMWPRDRAGAFRILRDVLIDLPEWGGE